MRVVTTVHKAGFEVYGHRWVDGIKNWPEAEWVMYAEGFVTETVPCKRIEDLPRLEAFKRTHRGYRSIGWEHDVVRFSNKVFAAYDALYDYDGLGVWLDADCVTHAKIPKGYIENLLPEGFYMGQFNRTGFCTETGFWVMNCSHPQHKAFLDAWLAVYESGSFKNLTEWHDCAILDSITRKFVNEKLIRVLNLSGEHSKTEHPMSYCEIGQWIDHCKGRRKIAGKSHENVHNKGV